MKSVPIEPLLGLADDPTLEDLSQLFAQSHDFRMFVAHIIAQLRNRSDGPFDE